MSFTSFLSFIYSKKFFSVFYVAHSKEAHFWPMFTSICRSICLSVWLFDSHTLLSDSRTLLSKIYCMRHACSWNTLDSLCTIWPIFFVRCEILLGVPLWMVGHEMPTCWASYYVNSLHDSSCLGKYGTDNVHCNDPMTRGSFDNYQHR